MVGAPGKRARYDPDGLGLILTTVIGRNPDLMRTFIQGLTLTDVGNWSRVSRAFYRAIYKNNVFWWAMYVEDTGIDVVYDLNVDYFHQFQSVIFLQLQYICDGFIPEWNNPLGQRLLDEKKAAYFWGDLVVAGSWDIFYRMLTPSSVRSDDGYDADVSESFFTYTIFDKSSGHVESGDRPQRGEHFPLRFSYGSKLRMIVSKQYDRELCQIQKRVY